MIQKLYDQYLFNAGSEAMPPYAVCQLVNPGTKRQNGRTWFTVGKPTGSGKTYFVNGPWAIKPNGTGRGARPFNTLGVHALYEERANPNDSPATPKVDDEWGPKKDSWMIGKGGRGFIILGDILGSSASAPGYPTSESSKRVRVSINTTSTPRDHIVATAYTAATPGTDKFLVRNIRILDGSVPEIAHNPPEPEDVLEVHNTFKRTIEIGDAVEAERSEVTHEWETKDKSASVSMFYGRLVGSLTTLTRSAAVSVLHFTGADPRGSNGQVAAFNLIDTLNPNNTTNSPRYLFLGNPGCLCRATQYDDGVWYFDWVQSPIALPT